MRTRTSKHTIELTNTRMAWPGWTRVDSYLCYFTSYLISNLQYDTTKPKTRRNHAIVRFEPVSKFEGILHGRTNLSCICLKMTLTNPSIDGRFNLLLLNRDKTFGNLMSQSCITWKVAIRVACNRYSFIKEMSWRAYILESSREQCLELPEN